MNKNQKGFSLLEIICCFVIFAFLLEGLWGVFGNIYFNYMVFDKQVELDNEGEGIESFIKTYIREADSVKVYAGGKIITYDSDPDISHEGLILEKIELETTLSSGTVRSSTIVYNSASKELSYHSNGGKNLIANEVENIKITRMKGTNLIEFRCELSDQLNTGDPQSQRKKVTTDFSETIDYKEPFPTPTPTPTPTASTGP